MRRVLFNVQLLRLAAASSILFTHATDLVFPGSPIVERVPWVAGVDLFFVISGFIMAWMTWSDFGKAGASTAFLRRRIIRVMPPYWFFTLITAAAVVAAGGQAKNVRADPPSLLSSLAFIPWPRADGQLLPVLPQGWTLNYEAFFYLTFALALLSRRGLLLLSVAFVGLAAAAPLIPASWFVLRFFANPIILEFVAGIGIARLYLSGTRLTPIASAALILFAVLLYRQVPPISGLFYRPVTLGIPATMIGAALILADDPPRIGWLGKAVIAGGDASYSLYLSHKLVVTAVLLIAAQLGLPRFIQLPVAITGALVFALGFYRWIEAPVLSWLGNRFGVRDRRVAAAVAP